MSHKKKKSVIDPNSLRDFEVTASLKWDENVEFCLRVQAPSKEAAYPAFREKMATLNKNASKRGDDLFEINIFKKPHTIIEIKKDDWHSMKGKK